MSPEVVLVVAVAVFVSFVVSAAVGLGGSLVMVPTLVLALGPKEGVALAALLLAANNVLKVAAYRQTLPLRKALRILVLTIVGAAIGAVFLTRAPHEVVMVGVIAALAATLASEVLRSRPWRPRSADADRGRRRQPAPGGAPLLALASGATSGFSGTSGPLKGAAVKRLGLDRLHTVGAASIVSLGGDLTKTAIFTEAGLLGRGAWIVAALAVPLMVVGTLTGRRLTRWLGDRRWAAVFWVTMAGYTARLVLS